MTRLYVRPAYRGQGLGKMLVARHIGKAGDMGYTRICLDTLPSMSVARHLYESLGFAETPAYNHNPLPGIRCLALGLPYSAGR
jgi:ribosomal protein S18 acetylase RimI-like enzyme